MDGSQQIECGREWCNKECGIMNYLSKSNACKLFRQAPLNAVFDMIDHFDFKPISYYMEQLQRGTK